MCPSLCHEWCRLAWKLFIHPLAIGKTFLKYKNHPQRSSDELKINVKPKLPKILKSLNAVNFEDIAAESFNLTGIISGTHWDYDITAPRLWRTCKKIVIFMKICTNDVKPQHTCFMALTWHWHIRIDVFLFNRESVMFVIVNFCLLILTVLWLFRFFWQ